jgi:hypothetical protein
MVVRCESTRRVPHTVTKHVDLLQHVVGDLATTRDVFHFGLRQVIMSDWHLAFLVDLRC